MAENSQKLDILKEAGFRYNFHREIYFNRQRRKVFSLEAIEDNNAEWLAQRMHEEAAPNEWLFYFNVPPSAAIKTALIQELS